MVKRIEDERARHAIEHVEAIPVHIPFRTPLQLAAGGPRPVSEVLVVRIKTADGAEGLGETQAWRRQGSAETLASLKYAIDKHLAPAMIGRSPFDLPMLAAEFDNILYASLYAKAPLLDALLDIQGKVLNVPVHDLLGGMARDRVRACAVLPIKGSVDDLLEIAREQYARGFRTFIVKVGLDRKRDFQNVSSLREEFQDVALRLDANASMEFDDALALLRQLAGFEIEAAEQMLPAWDFDGMAELASRVDVPMLADESLSNEHDLMDLIRGRAIRKIQTKIAKNGGIWNTRKIWTIAKAAGIGICPGNHPCAGIATAAAVHLAAAWEGPLLDGPFAIGVGGFLSADVVSSSPWFDGADVMVPKGPGLGVTLDEEALLALRVDL